MINKNKICRYIERHVINPNNSKYLIGHFRHPPEYDRADRYNKEKPRYYFEFRDRQEDVTYYRIKLKGNYIRVYEVKYINSVGKSINTFSQLFVPVLMGSEYEIPVEHKKLLIKIPFKEYRSLKDLLKTLTPNLGWYSDCYIKDKGGCGAQILYERKNKKPYALIEDYFVKVILDDDYVSYRPTFYTRVGKEEKLSRYRKRNFYNKKFFS